MKKKRVMVVKGKTWPSEQSEKDEWNRGFEKGATWVWGNYHVDEIGYANTRGTCLVECIKEYMLTPIESCGAAEGIRYGLSQIDKKIKQSIK